MLAVAVLAALRCGPLEAAPRVILNDKIVAFDVAPFIDIESNRVMVPMRKIFEALGAEVEWNPQSRSVTARLGEDTVFLVIGSRTAFRYHAGEKPATIELEVAPAIAAGDRTVVPVRFVAESLGANVVWEPSSQTVYIRTVLASRL